MSKLVLVQRWFVSLGFMTVLAYTIWHTSSAAATLRTASRFQAPLPYEIGETLPSLTQIDFTASRRTLLLFVRSNCSYCTASMPFYRQLAGLADPDVRIVAVCVERHDQCVDYLRREGFVPSDVISVSTGLRIRGTPTLMLVDQERRVLARWIGQQTATGETEIREMVTNGG